MASSPYIVSEIVNVISIGVSDLNTNYLIALICVEIFILIIQMLDPVFSNSFYNVLIPRKFTPYLYKNYLKKVNKVKFSFFYSSGYRDNQFLAENAIFESNLFDTTNYLILSIGDLLGFAIIFLTIFAKFLKSKIISK